MAAAELFLIGDVHGQWDEVDTAFLESRAGAPAGPIPTKGVDVPDDLRPTAIFVGDFGDEDVRLVEELAAVRAPKAIIFGNHDAWHTMRGRGPRDRVERQIALAGEDFIGYRAKLIAGGRLGLVGARPFSWGGGWFDREFYGALFGVRTMNDSADRIVAAAAGLPPDVPIVLIGHNGPRGLGATPHAIWGRDFQSPPVDWGDPDQENALERLRGEGRTIVAVVAGHMHERLMHDDAPRQRLIVDRGTTFINAAVVPRHHRGLRHFVHVKIDSGTVHGEDWWIDGDGKVVLQKVLTP